MGARNSNTHKSQAGNAKTELHHIQLEGALPSNSSSELLFVDGNSGPVFLGYPNFLKYFLMFIYF